MPQLSKEQKELLKNWEKKFSKYYGHSFECSDFEELMDDIRSLIKAKDLEAEIKVEEERAAGLLIQNIALKAERVKMKEACLENENEAYNLGYQTALWDMKQKEFDPTKIIKSEDYSGHQEDSNGNCNMGCHGVARK